MIKEGALTQLCLGENGCGQPPGPVQALVAYNTLDRDIILLMPHRTYGEQAHPSPAVLVSYNDNRIVHASMMPYMAWSFPFSMAQAIFP